MVGPLAFNQFKRGYWGTSRGKFYFWNTDWGLSPLGVNGEPTFGTIGVKNPQGGDNK